MKRISIFTALLFASLSAHACPDALPYNTPEELKPQCEATKSAADQPAIREAAAPQVRDAKPSPAKPAARKVAGKQIKRKAGE